MIFIDDDIAGSLAPINAKDFPYKYMRMQGRAVDGRRKKDGSCD